MKRFVSQVGYVVPMILGLVVITGWFFGISQLVQIHESFAPMQFNTALSFILASISVGFFGRGNNKLSLVFALLLTLISSITSLQYITGIDFGIDELFMEHSITTKTSHPGRMSPNTAFCFFLFSTTISISFFLKNKNYYNNFLVTSGTLVTLLGIMHFFSYMTKIQSSFSSINFNLMAVHTSVGFIFSGLGLTLTTINKKFSLQKSISAVWMSSIVTLTIIYYSVFLWNAYKETETNVIKKHNQEQITLFSKSISDNIESTTIALRRMAQRWELNLGTSKEKWIADAQNYVQDFKSLSAVQWIDNTHHIRWIEPLDGNEKALGLNITLNKERNKLIKEIKKDDESIITEPFELAQKYKAFISYSPIYIENKFSGFIAGIFNLETFIKNNSSNNLFNDYNLEIFNNNKNIYRNVSDEPTKSKYVIEKDLKIHNQTWHIKLWPKKHFVKKNHSAVDEMILVSGIIIALLSGLSLYNAILLAKRSKLLQISARKLRQRENNLEILVENLTDSNEELERFAYICSHDLQEPLRMIKSYSEILKKRIFSQIENDEKSVKYFNFISEGAERSQDLVKGILEYSSIDHNSTNSEKVNILSLINVIEENLSGNLEDCDGKIIRDKLPIISGNKTQLYQLFQNLINNGLKYKKPNTKPVVKITYEEQSEFWKFEISDNGIGIDSKYHDKIFEVFQRLHRRQVYQGTGIGLSICKKIVQRHNGQIWVTSNLEGGSTFHFTILKEIK